MNMVKTTMEDVGPELQEDKLVLECAAKEYLRRTSVIWLTAIV